MAESERVLKTIRGFLKRQDKTESLDLDASLYAEGIGLDSLQTAELSVTLEDELGRDPFSDGQTPQTVAEILKYYEEETS